MAHKHTRYEVYDDYTGEKIGSYATEKEAWAFAAHQSNVRVYKKTTEEVKAPPMPMGFSIIYTVFDKTVILGNDSHYGKDYIIKYPFKTLEDAQNRLARLSEGRNHKIIDLSKV